jgi:hypothetical protein
MDVESSPSCALHRADRVRARASGRATGRVALACVSTLILLAPLPLALARECTPARHAGMERFEPRAAEVFDRATGLLWQRCSAGQRYDAPAGRCAGEARLMRHAEARAHARTLGDGWRLPSVAELRGLVDKRCGVPTIDPHAFPGFGYPPQQGMPYWSATPFETLPSMSYHVDFAAGDVDVRTRSFALGVLPVRAAR